MAAHRHVKESLRPKYEHLLSPGDYDEIVKKITLKKSDYKEFLMGFSKYSSLVDFMKNNLQAGAGMSAESLLDEQVFNQFIDDFYIEYDEYFMANNLLTPIIKLLEASNDTKSGIAQIIAMLRNLLPNIETTSLPHHLTTSDVIVISRKDLVGRDDDIKAVKEHLEASKKSVLVNSMGEWVKPCSANIYIVKFIHKSAGWTTLEACGKRCLAK